MYRNNSIKNIIIKNSNNSKNSGINMIIWIIIYLVVAFLISYITVMTFKYLTTDCIDKKSWFNYVFRFCYQKVCATPQMSTVTHVNYNSVLPGGFKLPKEQPKINNPPADTVNIKNYTNTILSTDPKKTPSFEYNIGEQKEKPQVFHIANQDYSYNQAKCKCASYNAKLATYSQIVDAYNNGADWCSYGWSEGQNAFYPTQKCSWLKKNEVDRKACGKPGINGGFFGDPNIKFGANCFGKKPKGKVLKLEESDCDYCKTQQDFGANNKMETDQILPFNEKIWSA